MMPEPLKILIIRNIPTYMEIRRNTYNIQEIGLARALVRKGQICDILFWTDKEEEVVDCPVDGAKSFRVYYRRGRSVLKNAVFTGCKDLFDAYDVLQPCEINQMQSWILAGQYPGKTIIYHGPYYEKFNRRYNMMSHVTDLLFLGRYRREGTRFLAKSDLAAEYLASKGISRSKIFVAGVGMDTQMLIRGNPSSTTDSPEENTPPAAHHGPGGERSPEEGALEERAAPAANPGQEGVPSPESGAPEEVPLLRRQMSSDGSPLRLLYIGCLEERRNIPFVIDIFRAVLLQEPEARLYMIGTGQRQYVERCLQYMEKAGVRDRIVLQDRMEQRYLGDIYRLSHFFLLPTRYEIFGMVLMEAMYYGNVVLTTPNGGSRMLIRSEENGLVLDSADPAFWAGRILELKREPEKRHRIGTRAHQTIAEHFTWDALADNFLAQYHLIGM